jgi:hypothetical protein
VDAPSQIEQRSTWFEVAPLILGVGGELVILHIAKLIPPIGVWGEFGIAAIVLEPLAFLGARLSCVSAFVVGMFFLAGIACGVVIDAFTDTKDRNLFPLEIVWWWAVSLIPSALGIAAARIRRRGAF